MKKLIAGNWKMNGSLAANEALLREVLQGLGQPACSVAVAVPAVYLAQVQALLQGSGARLDFGNDPRGGARITVTWPLTRIEADDRGVLGANPEIRD